MRLPESTLSLDSALEEFDIWITASLGDITETEKYKEELRSLADAFEVLGLVTDMFTIESGELAHKIATGLSTILAKCEIQQKRKLLEGLSSLLFIATGSSNNNFKCQFPLYLRDTLGVHEVNLVENRRKKTKVILQPVPRVLSSMRFLEAAIFIENKEHIQELLALYIGYFLRNEQTASQLWSIGYSYFMLKKLDMARNLLAPLASFKVRGSTIASGGHEPEKLLRTSMAEWGLQSGIDFNENDVVIEPASGISSKRKTRAYDFILPYKTSGWASEWNKRIFIQSQFYAGDSGSVSHKNIDQTRASRDFVNSIYTGVRFVEYVDGAGYYSSLRGDLKKLLQYEDTTSFFQIKSAPIRLRRELQELGFLTPLEIEHAIAISQTKEEEEVKSILDIQGYSSHEIERAWNKMLLHKMVDIYDRQFYILESRRDIVRRYYILDLIAIYGSMVRKDEMAGKLLVPGYGPLYGISLDNIAVLAKQLHSEFTTEIESPKIFLKDVGWLREHGYVLYKWR